MAGPSSSGRSGTTITDLGVDTLAHCASFLSLRDVSNMAMSCRYLSTVAYSDSVWQSLFREEWPYIISPHSILSSSVREAYISRHTSLRQFKFLDPLVTDVPVNGKLPQHMLFNKDDIIFSQGPQIRIIDAKKNLVIRGNHKARITCMRAGADASKDTLALHPPCQINSWVMILDKYLPVEVKIALSAFGPSIPLENVASMH